MRVKEWMSASPTTTGPKTSVSEARELMRRKVIRHLLVTEGERLDYLLTKLAVGDVMTKVVITVEPELPIEEAARLMLEHRIGALPAVSDGRLVGILTETDLVRAFVYSQSAIVPATARG